MDKKKLELELQIQAAKAKKNENVALINKLETELRLIKLQENDTVKVDSVYKIYSEYWIVKKVYPDYYDKFIMLVDLYVFPDYELDQYKDLRAAEGEIRSISVSKDDLCNKISDVLAAEMLIKDAVKHINSLTEIKEKWEKKLCTE